MAMPPSPGWPADGLRRAVRSVQLAGRHGAANVQYFHYECQQRAELHDRMSLILEPDDWRTWLGEVEVAAEQEG